MSKFTGKLVVVTGAGSGIGRATAREFARAGARVVVSDINADSAKATCTLIEREGGIAFPYAVDVSDKTAMADFAAEVHATHGISTVLVNNAGFTTAGPFLGHSAADWDRIMGVNFWGVVHGSRLFGRQMVDGGQGGRILNVTSPAAVIPITLSTPYCTSKAAAQMLTECLRLEFARTKVGVTAVLPAFINTGFYPSAQMVGIETEMSSRMKGVSVLAAKLVARSPERLGRNIVQIASRNPAIAPTPFESRLACTAARLSPAGARLAARFMDTENIATMVDRLVPTPLLRRVDELVDRFAPQ
ncbi:SDR family NAD(P)-dependent oxidoreductase [Nocardia yamanashiensis]|uniref:SDR family NAD(P)-dependent oxidoreductase n=1 Tax=Nocardia yamanashiensis TaxID=209247 RepID=UPI0008336B79|nr:SDR family NAD(P)-dependent oxidoreductase [Nocardia yamanashiensis]